MTNFLDQSDDINHQKLYTIIKKYDAPEYVKSASFEEICTPETRSVRSYAYPKSFKLPCHTPAATWTSMAFLLEGKDTFDKVSYEATKEQLYNTAKYFDIKQDVDGLLKKHAAEIKPFDESELPDSDYAVVFENNDGSKERHVRLLNGAEIKAAAAFLHKFRDKFTFEQRQGIAERIFDKAGAYGVNLGEYNEFIEKQAGFGDCSATEAAELIWDRAKILGRLDKPKSIQVELAKVAQMIMTKPASIHNPGTLSNLAALVDRIDREYNIEYSDAVRRPEDVLFKITAKAASDAAEAHFSMTNGNTYKKADLTKLSIDDVRDYMGDDFVDRISVGGLFVDAEKMAEEAHTLPLGDARTLDRLLTDNGIKPLLKTAAATDTTISKDELFKLAQQYKKQQPQVVEKSSAFNNNQNKPATVSGRGEAIAWLAKNLRDKTKT